MEAVQAPDCFLCQNTVKLELESTVQPDAASARQSGLDTSGLAAAALDLAAAAAGAKRADWPKLYAPYILHLSSISLLELCRSRPQVSEPTEESGRRPAGFSKRMAAICMHRGAL